MGVFPIAVIGRQVAPRRAGAQNPENGIDKQAVITCFAAQAIGVAIFARLDPIYRVSGGLISPYFSLKIIEIE